MSNRLLGRLSDFLLCTLYTLETQCVISGAVLYNQIMGKEATMPHAVGRSKLALPPWWRAPF